MADPHPFRTVASFAADVLAAAKAGDAVARHIAQRAASLLAETLVAAAVALRPGATREVSATGGLMAEDDIADLVRAETRMLSLDRGAEVLWTEAEGGAIDGALRIAAGSAPLHTHLAATWASSTSTTEGDVS